MSIKCLLHGHHWDGCVCRRCGKKKKENDISHDWTLSKTYERCVDYHGEGQYNDPYYGDPDAPPLTMEKVEVYVCKKCGLEKVN